MIEALRFGTEPATSSTAFTSTTTVPVLAPPPAVPYSVSCSAGGGHLITFAWPGDPPEDVSGYDIRWRVDDGPIVLLTLGGWSDAENPPAELQSPAAERTTLITDYRDVDGGESTVEHVETDLSCP